MEINLKNKTGVIRLNSGHSMYLGNKPDVITTEMLNVMLSSAKNKSFEQFGLFESSSPNYTTYYPDVTADDLAPKDEDFITPIFRALSATVVWKGYKPIDFSKPGVLKAAMNLLIGQTINIDHETATGNAIGSVRSVAWQESYTDKGITVPAGINAEFLIDGKSNPRIARGIQMNPPSIHSNSVSVRFEWEPSHALKDDNDFYNKLGTKDDKGNLYRLIVTKVLQFSETSLVSHGADAYAQIIRDGKINNPVYASGVYKFSHKDDKGEEIKYSHTLDYKTDLSLDLSSAAIPTDINNNQNEEQNQLNMNVLEILTEKLQLKDVTEENFSEKLQGFLDAQKTEKENSVSEVQNKLDEANTEKERLSTEVETFKPKAEAYDSLISNQREEAKKLYNLSKGDKADAAILTMLENVDATALESLMAGYKEELELKFPSSCQSCGSTEITKKTSLNEDEEEEKEGGNTGKAILSNADARQALKDSMKKNKKN